MSDPSKVLMSAQAQGPDGPVRWEVIWHPESVPEFSYRVFAPTGAYVQMGTAASYDAAQERVREYLNRKDVA